MVSKSDTPVGKLSMVATPIGNLEDITLRALRTLKEANIVACEDTRVTKKLLAHFDIHTPTVSFHARIGAKGFEKIIKLLEEGKHVALVSDAGTPGVSDPGLELVSVVREHFAENLNRFEKKSGSPSDSEAGGGPRTFLRNDLNSLVIETIPGPSALTAAISVAGLRAPSFTFYGFLPQKKGRDMMFKEIGANDRASIFYESPHRIMKTLESLVAHLPAGRRIGVFRELTKLFAESVVGSAEEVLVYFTANADKQRGEFVVIVEGV
ncbi:MAG: ribosomal RNA small subunit methyltransferase I [Minisyncoccia bacterium]|jgi:16S rRNA (cytidine1402-2'-O)-methyltransferase